MRKIIELIHEKKKAMHRFIPKYMYWKKRVFKPFILKKVFIIGCPEYSNLGDNAILLAMVSFLKKYVGLNDHRIVCITEKEFLTDYSILSKIISKKSLLCGVGGGNMGNLWYNEELFRYNLIDTFPNNPVIIFPQTVYFTNDKEGKRAKNDSVMHYESHNNLTLVAREVQSLDLINKLYHRPKKIIAPDTVLSVTMDDYGVKVKNRSGALLIFRCDKEQVMSTYERERIKLFLDEQSLPYKSTDMYADERITEENRSELVRIKMQEFADSELVITDRLHGMIFAAITETPCIVFSNNHHKIKGTYDWISYLPYIKYANNIEEAFDCYYEIIKIKNCYFDRKPLLNYFEQLATEIKNTLKSNSNG